MPHGKEKSPMPKDFNAISYLLALSVLGFEHAADQQKQAQDARADADTQKELAEHDSLTGLSTRRVFEESCEREISRLQRSGGESSILFMDLDHFKSINDTYGHHTGDETLRKIANVMKERKRAADLLSRLGVTNEVSARIGGEEFAILLPDTEESGARILAESLRSEISNTQIPTGTSQINVTASVGVAQIDTKNTVEECLSAADAALYAAKERGRDQVVAHSDLPTSS